MLLNACEKKKGGVYLCENIQPSGGGPVEKKNTKKMKKTYQEVTSDHGVPVIVYVSDNHASYILTSAGAKDMYREYVERWGRYPSRQWFRRHYRYFEEIR